MPSICRLSTCMLTYGKQKTTKVSEAQAQVRPTSYCPAAQFCAQHAVHEFGGQSTHTHKQTVRLQLTNSSWPSLTENSASARMSRLDDPT